MEYFVNIHSESTIIYILNKGVYWAVILNEFPTFNIMKLAKRPQNLEQYVPCNRDKIQSLLDEKAEVIDMIQTIVKG